MMTIDDVIDLFADEAAEQFGESRASAHLRAMAALAAHDAEVLDRMGLADTITVPRPHVAYGPKHVTPEEADADYLRAAVKNIDYLARGERLWGSNLTATVRKLLLDAADSVEALNHEKEGTNP